MTNSYNRNRFIIKTGHCVNFLTSETNKLLESTDKI